ncbi:MAG TPA: c-type cytochrome, partial [Geminicoccaceae bacterium]|nr:c-type cytochrome [Geminicoccaceae bacterium]
MPLRRRLGRAKSLLWPACILAALTLTAPLGAADLELGREVYEKANCVGCHEWHGGGGGGYGG